MQNDSRDPLAVPGGSGVLADENSDTSSEIIEVAGRSIVWKFFSKIDRTTAKCNECNKILNISSTSTTSLLRHVRSHEKTKTAGEDGSEQSITPLNPNSARAKHITRTIANMIIWDLEPYSTVDNRGFRAVVAALDPRYKMPCRTTFSREIIPKIYFTEKERIKQTILHDIAAGVSTIAFTTDGWTSRSIDNYISLTVHYITKDFEPKKFTLALATLTENHTSKNLYEVLQGLISEWELQSDSIKAIYFITDNAANIVAAIRMGKGWIRIPCFAHTLQLAVKDVVKHSETFDNICRKARAIVSFFARSTTGHAKLIETQKNLSPEKKPLVLIQMVDTRWNSQHDMMERLLTLKKSLSVVLCDKGMPSNLTESEWKTLEEYVEVLAPVKEATVLMSGDTYPTLSQYLPVVETLKKAAISYAEEMEVDPDDDFQSETGKDSRAESEQNLSVDTEQRSQEDDTCSFADSLATAIQSRFKYVTAENDPIVFAMILDPRFKNRFITDEKSNHEAVKRLKWKATLGYTEKPKAATGASVNRRESDGAPKAKLMKFFDEFLDSDDENNGNDVDDELRIYLGEKVLPRQTSVLEWWSKNEFRFPILADTARHYLNIPASQTTSERLFSTAGNIVTPDRAQLLSDHVEQLVFLHENCTEPM